MSDNKMVIFTNKATTAMKTIEVRNYTIILKKPLCEVTNENYKILQFLTMILDSELYSELKGKDYKEAVRSYIRRQQLDGENIMEYASLFPERIYMSLYNGGVLQYAE